MAARARQAKPVVKLPAGTEQIIPQPPIGGAPWPATAIELRALDKLRPYERNARQHPPEQIEQIAASMREFGFTIPVLVDETGLLIAGHGRVLAAQRLVAEGRAEFERVPVMTATGWTDAQRRAYTIADNRLGETSTWDLDLLRLELGELRALDFDVPSIGFDDDYLRGLFATPNPDLNDPDAIPDTPREVASVRGDVWVLGAHRLVCGNSADPAVVQAVMQGEVADVIFTSPPYAQQRDYGEAKELVANWDELMQGVFAALPADERTQVLVNLGLVHRDNEWQPYWSGWIDWMRGQGWRRFGWYVWDQGPGMPGSGAGRPAPAHEFIFHFNRSSKLANKTVKKDPRSVRILGNDGRGVPTMRGKDGKLKQFRNLAAALDPNKIPDSVFRVNRQKGGIGEAGKHPAIFPVALCEAVLGAWAKPGHVVFEPFCGSGTQIVAAEKMGLRCRAVEIDPAYCDVAVRRWEIATGKIANNEKRPGVRPLRA